MNSAKGTVPMIKAALEQCTYRALDSRANPLRANIKDDVIVVADAIAYIILSQNKTLHTKWGEGT